jgi:acetylornithine deacetylase
MASPVVPGGVGKGGHEEPPLYRERLLSLHRKLVDMDSITGRENDVGELLIRYLTQHGFRTSRQILPQDDETLPKSLRFNVLAWPALYSNSTLQTHPRVATSGPRLLLTAHLDTVPPHIPYDIDQGEVTASTRIRGRGTADTKGSVAAQIIAVERLLTMGLIGAGDIMLVYVVGEETGGDGMCQFSRLLNNPSLPERNDLAGPLPESGFEAAIFGEPTENKLAKGHKGLLICTVRAKGRAGHSGYPWLGKSANELLIRALARVVDEDLGRSDRFGQTTVNVGVIGGGVAGNVIAEEASASLVIRVAAGPEQNGHDKVKARLLGILKEVDEEAFTVEWGGGYGAVPCNCDVDGKSDDAW